MSLDKAKESLTPTGTPTMNSTKRLSTIKTPGSPKTGLKTGAGAGGGGVKDVVSPGELCGFVRDFYSYFYYYSARSCQIMGLITKLRNTGVHVGGCTADVQVDTLLSQLETRFDEMSEQVL